MFFLNNTENLEHVSSPYPLSNFYAVVLFWFYKLYTKFNISCSCYLFKLIHLLVFFLPFFLVSQTFLLRSLSFFLNYALLIMICCLLSVLFIRKCIVLDNYFVEHTVLGWQDIEDVILPASAFNCEKSAFWLWKVSHQSTWHIFTWWWVFFLWILLHSLCLWCSLSLESWSWCRFLYISFLHMIGLP